MTVQETRDDVFAAAIRDGDLGALADECERRLRALPSGASVSFRRGHGQPVNWRMPVWDRPSPRPLRAWAFDAARAVLQDLRP